MNRAERRELYEKDYQKDENGRWRYIGQWYAAEERYEWKRYGWRYLLQIVLSVLLAVGMGFLPAGTMIGTRTEGFNYVILAYGITLVAAIASSWYAGKVMASKLRLPLHDKGSADWHEIMTVITWVASAALAILQAVYLFTDGHAADRLWDILLLAAAAALFALELCTWLWQRKLDWRIRENTSI